MGLFEPFSRAGRRPRHRPAHSQRKTKIGHRGLAQPVSWRRPPPLEGGGV
jgi:hypothetical protein